MYDSQTTLTADGNRAHSPSLVVLPELLPSFWLQNFQCGRLYPHPRGNVSPSEAQQKLFVLGGTIWALVFGIMGIFQSSIRAKLSCIIFCLWKGILCVPNSWMDRLTFVLWLFRLGEEACLTVRRSDLSSATDCTYWLTSIKWGYNTKAVVFKLLRLFILQIKSYAKSQCMKKDES